MSAPVLIVTALLVAIIAFAGYRIIRSELRYRDHVVEDAALEFFPHPSEARYRQLYVVAHCQKRTVNRYAEQWPDLFAQAGLQGLSPSDAQITASTLVDDYRKGLDFSAIDKEAIEQSVYEYFHSLR